jgi:hypothetical protein
MRASTDNIAPAQPGQFTSTVALGFLGATSTDFRRMISPWAYRHMHGLAVLRFAIGVFLTGLGAVLISHGFYGWASLPLAGAALHFAIGWADLTVARSVSSRSVSSRA